MSRNVESGSGKACGSLRHVALIACLTRALFVGISLWNSTRAMATLRTRYPNGYPTPFEPGQLFMDAISLALPLFYFCLLMERGRPLFSERLRGLSLGGASALAVSTALSLPASLRSLAAGYDTGFSGPRDSLALGSIGVVLGQLSNVAAIMVLIALYISRTDDALPRDVRFRPLRTIAMISAIGLGLFVLFAMANLSLNLLFYLEYLTDPQWTGLLASARLSAVARAWKEIGDEARFLLEQFGLFVGPYVAWRGYK